MNISAKTEYACVAVLELAAQFDFGVPVPLKMIAEKHGIPSRFLVQILLQLKGAGVVGSTRGASGGYQLTRDPADLTLGQVMAIIDGGNTTVASAVARATSASQALLATWQNVVDVQNDMLNSITFAELAKQLRSENDAMYYI